MLIDSKVNNSKGFDRVIDKLSNSSSKKALSITQLLDSINRGKKIKLNRSNVLRVVDNLKKYNPELIHCKIISGVKYYWLESLVGKHEKYSLNEVNKDVKKAFRDKIKNNEHQYYGVTQEFLNKFFFSALKFEYKIMGNTPLDRNVKFSNPDLIGICRTSVGAYQTASVEVKDIVDKTNVLTGFAQCCIYRTFSDFVVFACSKPQNEEQEILLNRICTLCNCYGVGVWVINETNLRIEPRKNDLILDIPLRNRIISQFLDN